MYEERFQSDYEAERLSSKREQIIEQLAKRVIDSDTGTEFDFETLYETANANIRHAAQTIIEASDAYVVRNTRPLVRAMGAGMNFAYITHDLNSDVHLENTVSQSLEHIATVMNLNNHYPSDEFRVYRNYEMLMQQVEARSAVDDCVAPERILIDIQAKRLSRKGNHLAEAFKTGYGFVRNAVIAPYEFGAERSIYNLEYIGVLDIARKKFVQHCETFGVHNSYDVIEYYELLRKARLKFEKDEKITRYFEPHQQLKLVSGVCKIISNDNDAEGTHLRKYHSLDTSDTPFTVSGQFSGFVTEPILSRAEYENLKGSMSADQHERIFSTGLYILLDNPQLAFLDKENKEQDPLPIHQTVLIPITFKGQTLIYQK